MLRKFRAQSAGKTEETKSLHLRAADVVVTEGANTVSECVLLGKPYLSIAPEGNPLWPLPEASKLWLDACKFGLVKGAEGQAAKLKAFFTDITKPDGSVVKGVVAKERDATPDFMLAAMKEAKAMHLPAEVPAVKPQQN